MGAATELETIAEFGVTDRGRKTVVAIVEFTTSKGARIQTIRLQNMRQDFGSGEWERAGYCEVRPQDVDEAIAALGRAYESISDHRGSR